MTADVRVKLATYLKSIADRLNTPTGDVDEETANEVIHELITTAEELQSANLVPGATTITSYDGGTDTEPEATEGLTLRSISGEPN